MKGIILTMNENHKFETVKNFVDSKSSNYKHLSLKLNCSLKTAYNLVHKYNTFGKAGFVHKNHFNKPTHALDELTKNKIIEIYKRIGLDINFTHFTDILKRDFNISVSRSTVHNILTAENILSPKARRVTIKKARQAIKQKLNSKEPLTPLEQAIVADHLLDFCDAHPRKSRSKYFGELIQMDASLHLWFGVNKTFLHAAIDDAKGAIVGAFFEVQETIFGYQNVFFQIFTKYGLPLGALTDNRSIFNYISKTKKSDDKDCFTQIGFMCHKLGITLSTSSVPQVKGRIERLFGTLQSRLVAELRLKNITTIEEANVFLQSYIEEYNKQFALPIDTSTNAFEKIDHDTIIESLAIVSQRKVDNGGCIKYKNKYFHFIGKDGNLVVPRPKTSCLVIKKFDGVLAAIIDESVYNLEEHQIHRSDSLLEAPIKKERKIYRPPLSHPLKEKSYLNYLKNIRHKQQNNYSHKYR